MPRHLVGAVIVVPDSDGIPGRSQHEAGLAIDFDNCPNRSTPTYHWLARNARKYGFYNLESEPWHWSTSGR